MRNNNLDLHCVQNIFSSEIQVKIQTQGEIQIQGGIQIQGEAKSKGVKPPNQNRSLQQGIRRKTVCDL